MNVWPRLPSAAARQALQEVLAGDAVSLRASSATTHPEAAPIAVGGPGAQESQIQTVRERIQALADSLGFPAELGRSNAATFDRPATRILHNEMGIIPADAASDEVWSFLTLVVLPDVAVWRFPARAEERLLGRPRNVFRRLWWRGETIGPDLIDAPQGLGEDELVNIMERPTLSANPSVARRLARIIVERGGSTGVSRSELMRDVSKRFLRQQAVVCMDALPSDLIDEMLETCIEQAAASLGAPPPPPPPDSQDPPAWRPDPSGRHDLRYWNGNSWTDHVADSGQQGKDPL